MAKVIVKENESLDSALKRFKKACKKEDIIEEAKRRQAYENPAEKRRRKQKRRKRLREFEQ